jgi:hypothetical protein
MRMMGNLSSQENARATRDATTAYRTETGRRADESLDLRRDTLDESKRAAKTREATYGSRTPAGKGAAARRKWVETRATSLTEPDDYGAPGLSMQAAIKQAKKERVFFDMEMEGPPVAGAQIMENPQTGELGWHVQRPDGKWARANAKTP